MQSAKESFRLRFGPFEVFPETGELYKHGIRIRLSSQSFKLLIRLLQEPGSLITRETLRTSLWTDGTFVDFEHGLNAAMNRLRERLGDSAEDSHYIETLPGAGYRFIAAVERLPKPQPDRIAVAPESDAPPPASSTKLTPVGHRWWRYLTLAGALVLSVSLGVFWLRSRELPAVQSIAVLPLQNASSDSEQQYLADGIADQVITELGRFRQLQVISRTSTEQYRRSKKPLALIARELNVKYLLEGSVAHSAGQVRINVHLVQPEGGRQIWSESYVSPLGDVFLLEDDVARAVAQEVGTKLTLAAGEQAHRPRTIPAPAMDAYLKGKFVQAKGTEEGLRQSIDYFQQAIKLAPTYSGSYAALSSSYCSLSTNYAPPREVMPQARLAAEQAIRLDSESVEAHSLLGRVAALYDWDWAAAERHLRRAVELNPSSAVVRVNLSTFLASRGRVRDALEETRKARELDPASLQNEVDLELNLYDLNQTKLLESSLLGASGYLVAAGARSSPPQWK